MAASSKNEDDVTADIFREKILFNILYDTVDGVKTNPRVDHPGFSVGGLDFQLSAERALQGVFTYGVFLDLVEKSKRSLAYDYEIFVKGRTWSAIEEGGQREEQHAPAFVPMVDKTSLFDFDPTVIRFEIDLEMKFYDIFPHRLQFVDEEMAKKNMNDCKIILVDDANKIIYANKTILASRSLFFRTLFFGPYKEKDEEVIKLSNVKEADFLEYLFCVYLPPNRSLAFKRIETLLCMADRFQNEELHAAVEKFLTAKKKSTSKEKQKFLVLAGAHNMSALFRATLKTMSEAELKKMGSETCKHFKKEHLELVIAHLMGEF